MRHDIIASCLDGLPRQAVLRVDDGSKVVVCGGVMWCGGAFGLMIMV